MPCRIRKRLYMGECFNTLVMRKIIFLINPISGTKNKKNLKPVIEHTCQQHQLNFEFADTAKDGNYAWLCERIQKEKITDVIVCGGDGSVSQVSSCLLNQDVNVGIIPLGSGNGLAFAAGISANLDKALQIIINGRSSYIDAFRINDAFSCMLCGIGFDAQVAHDFAKQKKRGLASYVKQTIRNFVSAKPYSFEITEGHRTISLKSYFISIANSNQFGNNFTIAPKASLSDGLIDIVAVNKMNKLKMIFSVLRHVKFGRIAPVDDKNDPHDIYYFQTKNICIKNPENAPLHIDGEPAQTNTEFRIEILEKAIRLLQP